MIHILPGHERGVIFMLGRFQGVKGPGLVILIPGLQHMTRVNLRPVTIELPVAIAPSGKEAGTVNAAITYHVIDPAKALFEISDYRAAMREIAQAMLNQVLKGHTIDGLAFERKGLEDRTLKELRTATAKWGIEVDKVEIQKAAASTSR
ncbi:MAG: hypothetical protein HYX43_18870 [Burkholderiales bacterium]|nr:hypothetical protein [Burkholderiales bacterium]